MDEYLKLLKHNTIMRKMRDTWKSRTIVSLMIIGLLMITIVFLIIRLCTQKEKIKEIKVEVPVEILTPQPVNENILNSLRNDLIEKDNEISQLKDRIAFLSLSPAIYEEEKKENNINYLEYINLFSIGQKVPLPIGIDTNTFRCMDYRTITDTTSWQYKIQLLSQTNMYNGLRYYEYNGEKYYTVALATAYGIDIGNAYKVELQNGTTFNIIHAEYKHDIRYPRPDDYGDPDVNYDKENTISVIEFVYDDVNAPAQLIADGEANRYLGEGCDIYGNGCNIKSMTYLGKIWSVN